MRTLIGNFACALLAACASYSGRGLEPGKSTGENVEAVMGEPAAVRDMPNGETVLWYPRLPFGGQSFAARIGRDGKLLAIEQRLVVREVFQIQDPASLRDRHGFFLR